jgi:hypothetical protein
VAGPETPLVRTEHAVPARCPYCNHLRWVSPDRGEVAATQHLPDPIVYQERVEVGGGHTVYFIQCERCSKHFVDRMAISNRAQLESWRIQTESGRWGVGKGPPGKTAPAPRFRWQGCSYETWMLEVLSNPNWMMRQKAERECLRRGIMLDWAAVALKAEAAARASG